MERRATILLGLVALVLGWTATDAPGRESTGCAPEEHGTPASFSLLAVGDTGTKPPFPEWIGGQHAVGRALALEDRRAPADLLVFLGDNFYPDGLEARDVETRIRANLVRPYCDFVALDGPLSSRVDGDCPRSGSGRHRLLAVLGNHDYHADESPALEREVVPHYVSNWQVPEELAAVLEVAPGVSLIAVDSERIEAGEDPAALVRALREARGPWRILVSHRPIAVLPNRDDVPVAAAIRAAGVPVHVFLAGHEHNLQAWTDDGPVGLHVVAGSGASTRPVEGNGQDFALASLGFVRVSRIGSTGDERLEVSLVSVPHWPWESGEPWPAARFRVNLTGHVEADASCPGVARAI